MLALEYLKDNYSFCKTDKILISKFCVCHYNEILGVALIFTMKPKSSNTAQKMKNFH